MPLMKKITREKRERDVQRGIKNRIKSPKNKRNRKYISIKNKNIVSNWLKKAIDQGLNAVVHTNRRVVLELPEKMNFYKDYELTTLHLMAIRHLSTKSRKSVKLYRLSSVNFDNLKSISTSAALVLTAELSKWDDTIRQKLTPRTDNWDDNIFRKLHDLGFFGLFNRPPTKKILPSAERNENIKIVEYIKGECGDSKKTRELKKAIIKIVGEKVEKWTFLHSGIDEAITNVTHHAYPEGTQFYQKEKKWYLTGSYNRATNELKVVFYDQGIGIPKSLPTSKVWEKALDVLSILPIADRKKDAAMLKAAIQLDRTSTEKTDRGKGLQDLLEFVRKREDGYLSILSAKGLYKLTLNRAKETSKSKHFMNAIDGTLIIWSVTLD